MNKIKRLSLQPFYFVVLVFIMFVTNVFSQTPTKCFEIESILVDACVTGGGCVNSGSPSCNCEGKNEMVRFQVGPTAINTSDININWPNNPYLGISPANATTAGHIAALNATIVSCGYLKEPIGGLLPAGKMVLLITSTDMCNTANSFANLSDTLYVIFQNAGNFAGHFVNYSSTPGLRTTIMNLISTGCSDTVTYDKSLLVNQTGGYGGSSAQNDGSTVEFAWPGVAIPTYVNHGCQAPFIGITSNAGTGGSICAGGTINLSGTATGTYTGIFWKGGLGSFSSTNTLNTIYTSSISETDSVILSMGVIGHCNDTIYSNVTVHITPVPSPTIVAGGSTSICQGNSLTLTASGGGTYLWNTGSTNAAITVSTAATYTVTVTNACGSAQATQSVSVLSLPTATINSGGVTSICAGTSLILWASGIGNFLWSTGITNDSITVSAGGSYTVTSTNSCGTVNDTITITTINLPSPVITPNGSTNICQGDSVTLTASGGNTYSWSTGSTSNSIVTLTVGTYSVTATNGCGSNIATVNITAMNIPAPIITPGGIISICAGDSVILNASGASTYLWSTGQTGSSVVVNAQGAYSVSSSNTCGTGSDTVDIAINSVVSLFSNDSSTGIAPLTVNFINNSSVSAINYLWTFGDSTTSTEFSPTHIFQNAGTYHVVLTVTNANGCIDTSMVTIIVIEKPSELDVPNVFTPNGDGINDLFMVKSIGIKDFNCVIYDRWGLKISEIKIVTGSWDGRTTSGLMLNDGTYYYIIKATDIEGKLFDKQGFVQLIKK